MPSGLWLCIHGLTWLALLVLVVRRMPSLYALLVLPPGGMLWLFVVITVGTIGTWPPILQNESGLEEHLLPGLEPNGVPNGLAGTVQPFSFNRLDQLETIAASRSCSRKMEVQRSMPPDPGFLESVRNLCTRRGIVLIFDECTSGFRETFGGLHLKYGVEPDMAMFGKALGNGYAITATIGRRAVMEAAQRTFISSTFWTERIGPTAALETLEVMERERSWETVTSIGLDLRQRWQDLADRHRLQITHNGLPALTGFAFQSPKSLEYKTLITQEMLKKGFLAGPAAMSLYHILLM